MVDDPDMIELCEEEIREELSKRGFDGENTPIIRGSALQALEGKDGPLGKECVIKLMEACDSYITMPERANDKPFCVSVEDVFSITGRGTVVTGLVEQGTLKVGNEIEIVGLGSNKKAVVTGIEMFRKNLEQAEPGDNAGFLLRGVEREEVQRGQVLAKPGSIKPHTEFTAKIYALNKDEGGRHTPFFKDYRPQFYFRTTDVTGSVTAINGAEMVMPGDNVEIDVTLVSPIAMEEGLSFAIREGGRTVGAGQILKIKK